MLSAGHSPICYSSAFFLLLHPQSPAGPITVVELRHNPLLWSLVARRHHIDLIGHSPILFITDEDIHPNETCQ